MEIHERNRSDWTYDLELNENDSRYGFTDSVGKLTLDLTLREKENELKKQVQMKQGDLIEKEEELKKKDDELNKKNEKVNKLEVENKEKKEN